MTQWANVLAMPSRPDDLDSVPWDPHGERKDLLPKVVS